MVDRSNHFHVMDEETETEKKGILFPRSYSKLVDKTWIQTYINTILLTTKAQSLWQHKGVS